MKSKKILFLLVIISIIFSCNINQEEKSEFSHFSEQFSDLKVLRYQIPGFDKLTLNQKKFVYYLTEAGLYGRDIMYDQNYRHNLKIRRALENIYLNFNGNKNDNQWKSFEIYLKRIWFSNGIHHHYSNDKFDQIAPLVSSFDLEKKELDFEILNQESLPESVYMIVDKKVELEITAISELSEWSFLPENELKRKAIILFSNQRSAKRSCSRNQRVIKVPNTSVFKISKPSASKIILSRITYPFFSN